MEAGFVRMVLTRGQTGLTVTQVALLLRDADVWAGSGKCIFNNTAVECRGGYQGCCLAWTNARICALHTKDCYDTSTHACMRAHTRTHIHTHTHPHTHTHTEIHSHTHQRCPDFVQGKRFILCAVNGLSDKVQKPLRLHPLVLCHTPSLFPPISSTLFHPSSDSPTIPTSPPPSRCWVNASVWVCTTGLQAGGCCTCGGNVCSGVHVCLCVASAGGKGWGMLGKQRDLVRGQVLEAVCIS